MKWFFGLVLVIALIAGALYGVGRFLLPNNLEVSRSIVIERPRAAVFAMANDLRIVKEWSPFYALDPDAEYAFSGEEAGPGQMMRWSSSVRQVGNGRMSIVRSVENREVESILELGDRAAREAVARFYSPDIVVSTDLGPDEPVLIQTVDSMIPPDEVVSAPAWITSTRFAWGRTVITPLAPGAAGGS